MKTSIDQFYSILWQTKYAKVLKKFIVNKICETSIQICSINSKYMQMFHNKENILNFQSFIINQLSMSSILSLGSTIVSSTALPYLILFKLPCFRGARERDLSTGALHRGRPQSPPTAIRDVHPHRCRPLKQPQGQSLAVH